MTLLPPGVKVHLALGYIDMRKGIDGLAMLVQSVLRQDPFSGHLFVFRGRTRANLIKIIFWDGTGLCLFTKRLEHGVFPWPPSVEPGASERASLSEAQAEIERLHLIIKKLQRGQFGRRAEQLDDGQLQLGFEDLNADLARTEARLPPTKAGTPTAQDDMKRHVLCACSE